MTTTGFVYDITCPNCGKNFSVNADEYKSITEQLTAQIEAHIRQEAKSEQETAVKAAIDTAVATANIRYSALEKKIAEEKAAKEIKLADLKHLLDKAEQEKKAAMTYEQASAAVALGEELQRHEIMRTTEKAHGILLSSIWSVVLSLQRINDSGKIKACESVQMIEKIPEYQNHTKEED